MLKSWKIEINQLTSKTLKDSIPLQMSLPFVWRSSTPFVWRSSTANDAQLFSLEYFTHPFIVLSPWWLVPSTSWIPSNFVLEKEKSGESNVSLSNWTILQIDYWCRPEYIKHIEWHFGPMPQAFQVDECSH